MKEFRKLLFDAERHHDSQEMKDGVEEPVKVALINDGVDAKDLEYSLLVDGPSALVMRNIISTAHIMCQVRVTELSWRSEFIFCALAHSSSY